MSDTSLHTDPILDLQDQIDNYDELIKNLESQLKSFRIEKTQFPVSGERGIFD